MNELFPTDAAAAGPYRVLARKYRPANFGELIGQEALVRTLTNAIRIGRIAHAFVLTGVRGIGKTTTARIIARALNCVGADGAGGPTAEPCGVCEQCQAIAQDRHVDVIEMDAASRTGVDDIRDLIEGVQYRPMRARYKIYIIDEVHMLSKNAFNALLKTLEEPPEHVKFVFATTEIRKVPITVLSRCQRFDLRRLDRGALAGHLASIAAKESVRIHGDALALLARAADGSVRDGLSLLDRAIAEADGKSEIGAEQVRAMLGLADRSQTLDLFELLMKGAAPEALALAREQYRAGADPLIVVQDLLEVTHGLTRLKLVPDQAAGEMSESERARAAPMLETLSIPVLSRAWQMLLKGVAEVQYAPQPVTALEMLLVRLAYVADLPTPGEIVAKLQAGNGPAPQAKSGSGAPGAFARPAPQSTGASALATPPPTPHAAPPVAPPSSAANGPRTALAQQPKPAAAAVDLADPQSFTDVVALFAKQGELILQNNLISDVHLVRFEPGRLEFRPTERAPRDLSNRVGRLLGDWTGRRWIVAVSSDPGAMTLKQQADQTKADAFARASQHPVVQTILTLFPGASIRDVRRLDAGPAANSAMDADGEVAPVYDMPDEAPPDSYEEDLT